MTLALFGGKPIRKRPFPPACSMGKQELNAVLQVVKSNILSRYVGCWHENFWGGPQVQELEERWKNYFNVKYAIAVNSCTSGLFCAVGALDVEPGDEIIVPPYTMSATVMAPLVYNAIPVFADIEPNCFCIDPDAVRKQITSRTKAIMAVDLFGLPYNVSEINRIAEEHGLVVIEDTAQAPGARYGTQFAGALGHIGVYSLNYHKHIHTGEGGVIVTNNDAFAERMYLIRNHAESVVGHKGVAKINNLIGFNYRLTELQAAIGICQLEKLDSIVSARQEICAELSRKIAELPAFTGTQIRPDCTHVYYIQPFLYDKETAGVPRDRFVQAVQAELPLTQLREKEGVLLQSGYVKPLYLLPIFQQKIAYGANHFPWVIGQQESAVSYAKGICPVAEQMDEDRLILNEIIQSPLTERDVRDIVRAFEKVWDHRHQLTAQGN